MSRAELADAVNDYLWRVDGRRSGLDAHTIARYERGAVRWPGANYRRALCAVLGATEAELGFASRRHRADADTDPLSVNLFSPFALEAVPEVRSAQTGDSRRVGQAEVHTVRGIAAKLASMENVCGGGGLATAAADAHLTAALPLLSGDIAPGARQALFEAVGNLSAIAAYCAFDTGAHAVAERRFRFALWCADNAGSWELRAATLADMARRCAYVGNADGALSLIELAKVRSDRLTHTTRAMLTTMRAQYLSTLGRFEETLSDIARADDHFAQRDTSIDAPWMCYYDRAEHLGSVGKALVPVALARRHIDLAAARLHKAVHSYGECYPRSRAFSRTRLATLTMRIGDPRDAASIGCQAVDEAVPVQSLRIDDELRHLAEAATPHLRIPEVAELVRTIAQKTEPGCAR